MGKNSLDELFDFLETRFSIFFLLVGTDGANLSHFWKANNLVKFRNFEKYSRVPKDHALGDPSVKLQLMM